MSSTAPMPSPTGSRRFSRRDVLSYAWWGALGLVALEGSAALGRFLWPTVKAGGFGGKAIVGRVGDLPAIGEVTYFNEQRFYLARLPSGLLALYRKCTHLGCVVPWRPDERSEDELADRGRFNCPCHGSIFDRFGVVRGGPAPRPLDIFPITIQDGIVSVDTGQIIQRAGFDESQVARL